MLKQKNLAIWKFKFQSQIEKEKVHFLEYSSANSSLRIENHTAQHINHEQMVAIVN